MHTHSGCDRKWWLAMFVLILVFAGCGGNSAVMCKINSITVSPATATVSHTAASPGNTQQFAAFIASEPSGCAFQLSTLTTATWSVSGPANVSIGATSQDPAYGKATCKNATAGSITVTATVPAGDGTTVSRTASLTCN